MRVPEEGQTTREIVDVHAGLDGGINVSDTIGDRERDFLRSGGTGLADMVTGNRNRIPLRNVLRAILEDVRDDTHGRLRREDVRAAGSILFQDIVLNRAAQLVSRNALLLGDSDVHGKQDGRRGVDRHRGRNLAEVDLVEQNFHIGEGVDGNADLADFAFGNRIIGVITNLRRKIESAGKARAAVRNQIAITLVGSFRRREAGIHTHRPETAAIHGRLNAAGERILAGEADLIGVGLNALDIQRRVEALLRQMLALRSLLDSFRYGSFVLFEFSFDLFIAHNGFTLLFLFVRQFRLMNYLRGRASYLTFIEPVSASLTWNDRASLRMCGVCATPFSMVALSARS